MAGAVEQLIERAFTAPGIGRKTASRLTFYLLKQPRESASRLSDAILQVKDGSRSARCAGTSPKDGAARSVWIRVATIPIICVVEEPSDIQVIEKSGGFRGRYHVLHGRLSPLDGVGPEALNVERLIARVREGNVEEVILATNPDVEGEATALYLRRALAALPGDPHRPRDPDGWLSRIPRRDDGRRSARRAPRAIDLLPPPRDAKTLPTA